jgi:hypothetical protein
MPAGLSAGRRAWQGPLSLVGGLLAGLVPLALGYLSVADGTFYLARVPLMALAYGSALVIIFIVVGCLMQHERRLFGLVMTVGVVAAIAVYALLVSAAAGSY